MPGARPTENNVYKFCFVYFPVFCIVPGTRPTEHHLQILFCLFSSVLRCARNKAKQQRTTFTNSVLSMFQCSALCQEQGQQSTTFTNSVLSMFQCSALCQEQGQQSRHVMCQLPDSEILEESNCDIGHRPADTRLCIGRCNASTNHWHERPWSSVSRSLPHSPTPRASTNNWHERPWSSVSRSPPHSPTPRARVHNRHRQYTRTQIADPQANTHRWGRDRFVSDTTRKRISDPQANTHRWGRDRFVSDTTRKRLYHHQQQQLQQQQSRLWRAHVDRIQRQQDLSRYFRRNMSRSERYNPKQTEYPHSYRSHHPRV